VFYNNEKMLPTSYSIAAWPQWLCITNDTVCCITTTTFTQTAAALEFRRLMPCQRFKNRCRSWA